MWVNLIMMDKPSLNGNIYPQVVLEHAVTLPPCLMYSDYKQGDCSDQLCTTVAFRIADGWLQTQIEPSPEIKQLIADGHKVVRAAVVAHIEPLPDERRLIVGIDRIYYVGLCDPAEASWVY